jgi:hypothetical protein
VKLNKKKRVKSTLTIFAKFILRLKYPYFVMAVVGYCLLISSSIVIKLKNSAQIKLNWRNLPLI